MRQPGVFGQIPLSTYTLIVLGFRVQFDSARDRIIFSVNEATQQLLISFPFLSGQVILTERSDTSSGVYKIVPYPPHADGKLPIRVKDCTALCPTYDEINRKRAPFDMLDGDVLCPVKGWGHQYNSDEETPVFIVQINWVKGGMILCFASMHNALDMNGQGAAIRFFAQAMRGETFSSQQVEEGNRDADRIVPFLRDDEEQFEHGNLLGSSSLSSEKVKGAGEGEAVKVNALWAYWRIPAYRLRQLKEDLSTDSQWVSTDDAVTALFVQRVTAARLSNNNVFLSDPIVCQRAINMRRILDPPISSSFMGHMVGASETRWDARSLTTNRLSIIASDLRRSILSMTDHWVRSFATFVRDTEDKTTINYGAHHVAGKDISVSSWAGLRLLSSDFGPELGMPDFARRPNLVAVPDLAYIMPITARGDMDIGGCLLRADLEALEQDEVWKEYADLIG